MKLSYPKKMMQSCPLCGTEHPILTRGMMRDIENPNKIVIAQDKGYSFCNCKNIFFTKWENIDQEIYDDEYVNKYDSDANEVILKRYTKAYFPILKSIKPDISNFIEIGSISDAILDDAKAAGWSVCGFDIAYREGKHFMYFGDVENVKYKESLGIFDVVWMSHVVEHLKDPIGSLEKLKSIMSPDALLFVAMPDPFFIDHNNVYGWQHWWVKEHHILWDMKSFVDEIEKIGFKCEMQERNINPEFICNGDFHLIFKRIS